MIETIRLKDESVKIKRIYCPICSKGKLMEIVKTPNCNQANGTFLAKCPRCKSTIVVNFT